MRYLVAYDVSDDRVRLAVCEAIDDYGIRVQKSVFECEMSGVQLEALRARLAGILGRDVAGNVRLYHLCDRCARRVEEIGSRESGEDGQWVL